MARAAPVIRLGLSGRVRRRLEVCASGLAPLVMRAQDVDADDLRRALGAGLSRRDWREWSRSPLDASRQVAEDMAALCAAASARCLPETPARDLRAAIGAQSTGGLDAVVDGHRACGGATRLLAPTMLLQLADIGVVGVQQGSRRAEETPALAAAAQLHLCGWLAREDLCDDPRQALAAACTKVVGPDDPVGRESELRAATEAIYAEICSEPALAADLRMFLPMVCAGDGVPHAPRISSGSGAGGDAGHTGFATVVIFDDDLVVDRRGVATPLAELGRDTWGELLAGGRGERLAAAATVSGIDQTTTGVVVVGVEGVEAFTRCGRVFVSALRLGKNAVPPTPAALRDRLRWGPFGETVDPDGGSFGS